MIALATEELFDESDEVWEEIGEEETTDQACEETVDNIVTDFRQESPHLPIGDLSVPQNVLQLLPNEGHLPPDLNHDVIRTLAGTRRHHDKIRRSPFHTQGSGGVICRRLFSMQK